MKARYENFECLAQQRGLSNYKVSKATGIAQETLSKWKQGVYAPKREKIEILASFFNVPVDYFYVDRDFWGVVDIYNEDKKEVFSVAAGEGAYNEAHSDRHITTPDAKDPSISFVEVHGDSMYPDIKDGDILKVHHQYETLPTDYTVVKVDSEHCTVKFVEKTDTGVWLRAINKDVYPDKFFTVEEIMTLPVRIIGKAVEVRREL